MSLSQSDFEHLLELRTGLRRFLHWSEQQAQAAGLTRAALLGAVEAGLCAMYAASYPERVSALVLVNVAPAGVLGGAAPPAPRSTAH